MVSYEVSIGLILIVRLVSAFGSAKAIARMDVPLTQPGNGTDWREPQHGECPRLVARLILSCGS